VGGNHGVLVLALVEAGYEFVQQLATGTAHRMPPMDLDGSCAMTPLAPATMAVPASSASAARASFPVDFILLSPMLKNPPESGEVLFLWLVRRHSRVSRVTVI